jgi:methyl-accepting chemotaxis protein
MHLTIGKRLALGTGVLLTLLLVLGGINVHSGYLSKQGLENLSDMSEDMTKGADAVEGLYAMRIAVKDFLIERNDEAKTKYADRRTKMNEIFADCEKAFQNPQRVAMLAEMREKFKEYDQTFGQIVADISEQQRVMTERMNPAGSALSGKTVETMLAAGKANAEALSEKAAGTMGEITGLRAAVLRYMATGSEKFLDEYRQRLGKTETSVNELVTLAAGTTVKSAAEGVEAAFKEYKAASSIAAEKLQQARSLVESKLDVLGPKIAALGVGIKDSLEQSVRETSAAAESALRAEMVLVGVVVVLALVIGVVSGLLTARSIVRPLNAVVLRLKDIAEGEGDLTQRVDEARKDELGELGRWFNVFVGKIQTIMKDVASSSNQVAAASTQIAASAEEMAAGLKQQQEQTTQVSAAVEEMSQSIVEVAKKSADAANAAQDSGKQATTGGDVVQKTVVEMKGIAQQVTDSAQAVGSLGKKSEQIGQIIGVINDIADQTNLLALNAAIEAARAGEHGRGFAVVADEVRKLAERTTQATEEVARSIREIQGETTTAVQKIEGGSQQVAKGVELAGDAGQALEKIVASSSMLQSMVQSIAAAAEEQSAASEQIARSVEQINAVTRESNQGASQAAQAASQLSAQAESLQRLVSRFKV